MRTGSSRIRISDRADLPRFQILYSVDVVDHLSAGHVVEKPVDREVSPARVLLGGAEYVVLRDQQILRLGGLGLGWLFGRGKIFHFRGIGPKSGQLKNFD